jgi:MYXO-CTERM domain-containing protein
MRTLAITMFALGLCSTARADTFVISYEGRAQLDPVETFEADCLGASEATDCATRASLLEAELVEGLAELEGLSDDATKTLFTNAVGSTSDAVKEVGLRYFARRRNLPSTLWTSVKEFFLGPDPQIGQPSAEILGSSTDMSDQELSDLYLEFRPSHVYDRDPLESSGEQDTLALAYASDGRLDEVPAFAENEQFTPASRLLVVDRYLNDYQTGKPTIPSTGFVTDAPRADAVAFFNKLFGKPASPPLAQTQTRLQELNLELAQLQPKLLRGDQAAIKRVQAIAEETTALSEAVTVASALQLDAEKCADCVYWLAGASEDAFTEPLTRAVVVGTQPQLKRTTISYLSGNGSVASSDGGVPMQTRDAGRPTQGRDAGTEPPAKKSDGGCSTHGDASSGAWLLALGLLLVRRRRVLPA